MKKTLRASLPALAVLTAGTYVTGWHWYNTVLFVAWGTITLYGLHTERRKAVQ